jgi:signal peptidase I
MTAPERAPAAERGVLLRIADVVAVVVAVVVVLTLIGIVVGRSLGYRTLTVEDASMAPALQTGDLVVSRSTPPLHAHPGDIVTFRNPQREAQLLTQRVVDVTHVGDTVFFTTRADASGSGVHWQIPVGGAIGEKVWLVPRVGSVFDAMGTVPARGLEGLIVVLWVLYVVLRWRTRRHGVPAAAPRVGASSVT